MKLRTHFALLVAVTAIPLLALAVALLVLVQRQGRASVERGLQDRARALAVAVDREFESSVRALQTLGMSRALDSDDLQAFYDQAQRAREANARWLTVFLSDARGRQVLSLLRPFGAALPRPEPPETVRAVLETGRPQVSNLLLGPLSQRHVIVIAVPIVRGGAPRYVLGAGVSTDALADLLAQQVGSAESIAAILDRNNVMVARSRDHPRYIGQPARAAFLEAMRRARAQGDVMFVAPSLEGVPHYITVSRVRTSDFVVVAAVPVASVAAGPHRWLLAIGAVVILAGALGAALVLARRVTRSIDALSDAAAQLAEGRPILDDARPTTVAEVTAVHRAMVRAAQALGERSLEQERRIAAEAARAEAEAASRAKDDFLAMLGHELRNPLAAIGSAASVLDRVAHDDPAAGRAREIIARQNRYLVGIVDDLLDVGRLVTGKIALKRQVVDLGAVVQRAVDNARTAAGCHVTVSAQPVWVDADETRLEQIVNNLLGNALKYTPAGGTVDVSVGADDATATLTVKDTGIGIAPDQLPRIFDLFYQGEQGPDRADGGLGIGLTLVKRLVELHGGTVSATSDGPNRGATFVVRLRRAAVPAPKPGGERAVASSRRVLVVEDNADAREMLVMALRLAGHDVYDAADARSGLELADTVAPDVALVDIGLPDLDGYAFAQRLRSAPAGRRIALVALTGYGQSEDRRRTAEAGFDAHLVKPVDPAVLERTIATATAR